MYNVYGIQCHMYLSKIKNVCQGKVSVLGPHTLELDAHLVAFL